MDALVAELKATQQERREAEARLADPEGYERDLRDQEQVERLTPGLGRLGGRPRS